MPTVLTNGKPAGADTEDSREDVGQDCTTPPAPVLAGDLDPELLVVWRSGWVGVAGPGAYSVEILHGTTLQGSRMLLLEAG